MEYLAALLSPSPYWGSQRTSSWPIARSTALSGDKIEGICWVLIYIYIYTHAAVECMEAWNSLVWAEAFDWVSSMLGNLQNSMCLIVISFVYHCDSFPRGGVTRGWQSQFVGMEVKWSEYLWNSMSIMGTVPHGTPVLFCMRACWLKYLFLHGRE